MKLTSFRIRRFLTAILLSVLIIGGGTQTSFAKWSDGRIPVFTPSDFSISNKFRGIYYVFNFKKENNGNMAELTYSECGAEVCKFRFSYNGMNSELFIVDREDSNTYLDLHIGFFKFSHHSGAYDGDSQSQFLLLRMYINSVMKKDFGIGYIGIAYCKELDVCWHIEDVVKRNSINYDFYEKTIEDLSRYKSGNEVIFENINKAFYFLNSLSDTQRDDNR
ncbi:hypothetical protein [Thalassospira lohafexi]|uniref:Uncharacterized protein n=1 Tax=Thalassospira lohafexi TaxID=744227 RepID=A0A2N3L7F2_9PROT|nr:hypothetical protein [Thalassospira lohafexi]PKR58728.1 hypothetical protein COO92_07640 [Thalassospira lohafexi]